jgi:hypothetical protein
VGRVERRGEMKREEEMREHGARRGEERGIKGRRG